MIMNSERFWQNKDRSLDIFGHLCNEEAVNFLIYAKTSVYKEYKKVITLHSSALHNSEECILNEFKRLKSHYKNIETDLILSKREMNSEIILEE